MNPKIRFNTLVLFLVVSLIACTSKKEKSTTKQKAVSTSIQSQSNLNELHDEHNLIEVLPNIEPSVYDVVEQMPQFPGGDEKVIEFISKHLKYPAIVLDNDVQGKVIVRFVVTKTGKVDNCEVLRSLDSVCDKEALRVIRLLPKWIPGKQNGVNVNVYYTLPVSFKLE